ncbi:MAG: stage II sporulation protein M [Mucilaginibacter polytrichastri]|nr:stage II sporulation protein M [Mucilaginibacter polytrichastri]
MREPLFVKRNADKWKRYENEPAHHPDELAERFIEITDDLAYARTFYPQSRTTAFLNGLASRFHQRIYRNKKERSNRFVLFWKTELPLLFFAHRKQLLISLLFFLSFGLIGFVSARYDDTFVRLILGDRYVNMTEANIAAGKPFAVYDQEGETSMFLMIGANNIYVSLLAFAMGIFFSVGTLWMLLQNGLMLGSFQYFFFSKSTALGLQSLLVIWLHGTLEISAIVIAGGAGLVMGNGLLFPGTYKRMYSFKRAAKEGLKIVLGLVPVFICAAFIEGFFTRHAGMPLYASLSLILLSAVFLVWYVILYPRRLTRRSTLLHE